jgi:hypothetical protein
MADVSKLPFIGQQKKRRGSPACRMQGAVQPIRRRQAEGRIGEEEEVSDANPR